MRPDILSKWRCGRGHQDINTDFDEDAEILLLASCCNEDNEKMKKRKYWVHPILQKRNELGEFHTLIPELELDSETI